GGMFWFRATESSEQLPSFGSDSHPVRRVGRAHDPFEVQRPPESARPRSGPRAGEPLGEDPHRLVRVDEGVGVLLVRAGLRHGDGLVPAMHAGDRVWLYGEGEVLVHSTVPPPDTPAVRVGAVECADGAGPTDPPLAGRDLLQVALVALPAVDSGLVAALLEATHVVAAGDDAGPDAFGHPGLVHVPADPRRDL